MGIQTSRSKNRIRLIYSQIVLSFSHVGFLLFLIRVFTFHEITRSTPPYRWDSLKDLHLLGPAEVPATSLEVTSRTQSVNDQVLQPWNLTLRCLQVFYFFQQ
jgi:hypothetical protein